ncbi:hypothetical protein ACFC8N_39265 [Streptomyces sp. NPDC055966]|uniref:hypothetical protein n=1 Tax=unclassified Streptomyces TaxID=2593676 RepID=UPI0035D9E2A2
MIRQGTSALPRPRYPRRLAAHAGGVCCLAVVAAVVSFIRGGWVGIVWVLPAGLASNMAWYYARRGGGTAGNGTGTRAWGGLRRAGVGRGAATVGCASGGTCVSCVETALKETR